MKKNLLIILFSTVVLPLSACSASDIPNPFEKEEADIPVTDVVFDEAADTQAEASPEETGALPDTGAGADAMIAINNASDGTSSVLETAPDLNDFEGYILTDEDVSENGVYCRSVKNPGEVTIVFGGDIDFDSHYANMNSLKSRGGDISSVLSPGLLDLLKSADICMLNNEFPYSNRGTPLAGKKFTFRADPSTVHYLHDMGADIVGLANNHAYDHGPDALLDTFDTLNEAGIPFVGAGHNIEEAMKPVYFIAGGMKIGFVAATQIERMTPPDTKEATETDPGVLRTLDPTKFLQVIKEAKEHSDFVVVFVHWGTENKNDYEASQKDLALQYAQSGADLIIGAHPHVLQGFDFAEGIPVMYSMGNFWFNSKTLDNCAIEAVLSDKKLKSLRFVPCQQRNCTTTMFEKGDSDFDRIIRQMRTFSTDCVDIDDDGYVTYTSTPSDRPKQEASASSKPAPAPEQPAQPDQAAIDAALAAAAAAAQAADNAQEPPAQ